MGNAVFPTMPGLTWNIIKTPSWKTNIQESVSGKEIRAAYQSRPIWHFSLSYEFLRGGNGFTELQQLVAFFNQRLGSWDSFLFTDSSDNAVVAQAIGTGNGSNRNFQLLHNIGAWLEPVGHAPAPTVYVNGSSVPFSIADGVNVVLNTAPAAGAAVTWTGSFYYRVRFAQDSMEFDQFMKNLWALKKCELRSLV